MLTLSLKESCNNANSHPNIFKLQLFLIQLNPLCLQWKSNWTGSLCQPFPISQQAHSSPQRFCSLAQHTHSASPPRQGQATCPLSPAAPPSCHPLSKLPFPPSTHPAPSFYHPAEKEEREESSRQGGREKDKVVNQHWVQALNIHIQEMKIKIQGRRPQSLVTIWHSGNLWWATGESRFPQHLYSLLRSRLKWKIEENGYTCTKAGVSWAV